MTDEGREARDEAPGDVGTARGRGAVAASILAVLLVGGYFAASLGDLGPPAPSYLITAVVVAIAFWFPALRLGAPGDLARQWAALAVWLLAWTLVWDLATSGIVGHRRLLDDGWVVYPGGVVSLFLLLLLHAAVVERVGARPGPDGGSARS